MIRFTTFGPPWVEGDATHGRVHLSLQPKQLALLAYLCLESSTHAQRRDRVLYVLWPELDQRRARAALSQAVYRLRQQLGVDVVRTVGHDEIAIDPRLVWSDVAALEACIAEGRLGAAVRLYTGDFLDGFHLSSAADFERWLSDRRERLREAVVTAALAAAASEERAGNIDDAIRLVRRALEISPLEERAIRRLLLLLDQVGQASEAARVYDAFAQRLADEYDLVPAPETQDTAVAVTRRTGTVSRVRCRSSAVRSLAVVSFRALGDHANAGFLANGLPEEIVDALGRLRGLAVIAGNSSVVRFTSGQRDPREIGVELDVDAVLEGSVQVNGKRTRIHTRLVSRRDGAVLWSRTFGRVLSTRDLFSTQEAVARAIANALQLELDVETSARLARAPTENLEAYALCLEGRHAWSRRSRDALETARRLFRRAIEQDAAYAAAWSGLADTLTMLPLYTPADAVTSRRSAREAAYRAIALDEGSAEAHAALARCLESERLWDIAGKEFRRALELNPNYASARHWYANHLLRRGDLERGLREIEWATRLDPLSPAVWIGYGFILYLLRRYDRAIEAAAKAIGMETTAEGGHLVRLLAEAEGGKAGEAVAHGQRFVRDFPDAPRGPGALAYALAKAGDVRQARAMLRRAGHAAAEPLLLAVSYVAVGDPEGAFHHLASVDWGTINVDMVAHSAAFDPLRADPRFREICNAIDIPVPAGAQR